jgi:hypothetical protein
MFFDLSPLTLRKLSAVKHALPVLEALDIMVEDFADHDSDSDSKAALDTLPWLCSLRTDMSSRSIKIPLDQLEYLEPFWRIQKDSVEWLHRCSNLIECKLGIYKNLDTELSPPLIQQLIYRPLKLMSLPLLCPRLQVITFEGAFEVDGQIFGDMVASR